MVVDRLQSNKARKGKEATYRVERHGGLKKGRNGKKLKKREDEIEENGWVKASGRDQDEGVVEPKEGNGGGRGWNEGWMNGWMDGDGMRWMAALLP